MLSFSIAEENLMHHGVRTIQVTGVRYATVWLPVIPGIPSLEASITFSEAYEDNVVADISDR
jgi:hypothetical protein